MCGQVTAEEHQGQGRMVLSKGGIPEGTLATAMHVEGLWITIMGVYEGEHACIDSLFKGPCAQIVCTHALNMPDHV